MFVNKKVLAVAVVGALFAGNASAVNLSAATPAPAYYAKEIIAGPGAAAVTLTTTAPLQWDVGYNFSDNEVRYARVECSGNFAFDPASVVTSSVPGVVNFGSVNGLGTNVLTFSVTSIAPNVQEAHVFSVNGSHDITSTSSNVSCTVGLYDQPSQAQAGGNAGLITNSVSSGTYLAFAPSYRFVTDPMQAIADVEADPSFTTFTGGALTAPLAGWVYGLADPDGVAGPQTATLDIDGTPITLADLMATGATGTKITVTGDFALAANANGTFTGAALNRVFVATDDTCVTPVLAAANTLNGTTATFNVGATALPAGATFCVTNRAGNAIAAADYTATLNAVSAAPAVYAVSNIGPRDSGSIIRNGTELQAPLAQVPAGWLSRMVLTNTGGIARPYTIRVMGENGNTISTANLGGTVPANGTTVVDLNTVLTGFTAAPRATLVVTVAGPNAQIQGLYQIVNPDKGSISNHVMVRPGTN